MLSGTTTKPKTKVSYWLDHPINPASMARACRKLASDMRYEAAAGWDDIRLVDNSLLPRHEAADRLDQQAIRWEIEASGGAVNVYDRLRCESGGHYTRTDTRLYPANTDMLIK